MGTHKVLENGSMTVCDQSSSAAAQTGSPAMSETDCSVAIVIPAFNREPFIRAAIDSAMGQTSPADEIIVVDDGSTDRTAKIVETYPSPVKLIRINNNGAGPSRPRNVGIATARAKYITILDSDDRLEPTVLERHRQIFAAQKGVGLICNNFATVYYENGRYRNKTLNEPKMVRALAKQRIAPSTYRIRSEVAHDAYCTGNFVKTSSASFPKVAWEAVGGFDETLRVSEDYDFFMRLVAGYDVAYIDEPLELSVYHFDNISGANLRREINPMFYTCHIRALRQEYSRSGSASRRGKLRASIRRCLFDLAYELREAGDYRNSLVTYLKYSRGAAIRGTRSGVLPSFRSAACDSCRREAAACRISVTPRRAHENSPEESTAAVENPTSRGKRGSAKSRNSTVSFRPAGAAPAQNTIGKAIIHSADVFARQMELVCAPVQSGNDG